MKLYNHRNLKVQLKTVLADDPREKEIKKCPTARRKDKTLFLTVLTDMVCFTHYKSNYSEFRKLTRYPKFIGNCPGSCNFHYHPSDIFFAMNKGRVAKEQHLMFYDKFLAAFEIMKEETINFFNKHLAEINGEAFWEKCQKELPFKKEY